MKIRAAAKERISLLLAAVCLLSALLLTPAAEASRGLPAALAPALTAPSTPDQVLEAELSDPPERLRIFDDLSLPPRPLELVEARKTASGSSTYNLGLNVWQTGGLSRNCSGLSFQGLWTDPVTGIAYARNRWYDARTASWLSEDPMGAVDSPNLYAFVGWGPHVGTDPLGLSCPECPKPLGNPASEAAFTQGVKDVASSIWSMASGCALGALRGAEDDYGNEQYLWKGCWEATAGQSLRDTVDAAREHGASNPLREGTAVWAGGFIPLLRSGVELYEGDEAYGGPVNVDRHGGRIVTEGALLLPAFRGAGSFAPRIRPPAPSQFRLFSVSRVNISSEFRILPTKLSRAEQMYMNSKVGKVHEYRVGLMSEADLGSGVVEQLKLRPNTASGSAEITFVADFAARESSGLMLTEAKGSATARLSSGQRVGYPLTAEFGATVENSAGGALFPKGTVIPPSGFRVIRPSDLPPEFRNVYPPKE